MVVWFILIGSLVGLAFAVLMGGKGRIAYSLTEIWHASLGSMIAGAIIGAVVGVILSLFAVFNLGVSGLLATLIMGLGGALFTALLFGSIIFIIKGLSNVLGEKGAKMVSGLFGGALIGLVIGLYFSPIGMDIMPEYLKFADPLREGISGGVEELVKFRHCFYADPRCPFFVNWEDPNVQSIKEEFSVDVDFSENKILMDNTINLIVSLSVSNPELAELKIKPRCYFKREKEREFSVERMGSYAFGDSFVFPTTAPGQKLHTSFRCVGEISEAADKNIYSEYIVVELERPVAVKTIWPVWIGEQPKMGIVKSEMKFNAPYLVSLGSYNDMPFEEGREYDFQLTIKRKDENTKFKELDNILVKFPENVLAECKYFEGLDHEIEITEYGYKELKNLTQYSEEDDKFIFPCSLYVVSAPKEAVMAPFELEAYYIVYSDYKVRVIKSP